MYRAYYGTAGSGDVPPLEKDRWPFAQFSSLDDALNWARRVARRGTSVIEIDGDDGTQMRRSEIASFLR